MFNVLHVFVWDDRSPRVRLDSRCVARSLFVSNAEMLLTYTCCPTYLALGKSLRQGQTRSLINRDQLTTLQSLFPNMVSIPLARQSSSSSSIDDAAPAKHVTSRLSNQSSSTHIRDNKLSSSSSVDVDETVVRAEGEERTTSFVWFLVTAAATGGLLFGFDVRVFDFSSTGLSSWY